MRKIKLLVASLLSMAVFTGCACLKPEPTTKVVYVHSQCPTFDAKLKLRANELNEENASVPWSDIDGVEVFLKQKEVFNEGVKKLNKQ